jgi:hypothetical protein
VKRRDDGESQTDRGSTSLFGQFRDPRLANFDEGELGGDEKAVQQNEE